MLGSTELAAILGSGVDGTNHEAVKAYIKTACSAGLSLLLIHPGSKAPFDGRTARQRTAADKAAQAEAKEAGRKDWAKVKSPSGLALASSDSKVVLGYLKNYLETFGDEVSVNLAVEVGGSRLVIVDCDTQDQRERFLEAAGAPADTPPTVISPGSLAADGKTWVHEPGNGHYWFTVPDGVELPTNTGAMTWDGDPQGFAVLWNRRYVLIPPSVRAEGRYELLGRDYPLPGWLHEAITERADAKFQRAFDNTAPSTDDLSTAIDSWAESISWADILEPLGWTPTARPDTCGCDVWTAPGPHASSKSATAHDGGCSLGRYTETNAPLHIWTDNPGEPFDTYAAENGTKTISKLQAVAYAEYGGNIGKAMDALDLGPAVTEIQKEMGVSKHNVPEGAEHSPAEDIVINSTDSAVNCERVSTSVSDDGSYHLSVPSEQVYDILGEGGEDSPFDEPTHPDSDVFDTGMPGLPIIAPWTHWRDLPPPEYVIEGLIEHGGLSSIIGPPGVGKSSVALDMACHIAVGRPWHGRKTLKTRVLYLPGEGLSGANQRIKAWTYEHDIPDEVLADGLRVGNSILQLRASTEAWGKLAEYIIRQRIGLIIFDTFARMSLGIEENSASEVGEAIVRFDQMRRLTNAGVLVVHHTSKNNPAAGRGSSALNGAMDSELLVSEASWTFDQVGVGSDDGRVPSGKPIQLSTTKQKNAEQLEHPMPLLMRNCSTYDAPYITGPNGHLDPMVGDVILARPVDEPIVETAIRIRRHLDQFTELGLTKSEITMAVRADPYTASRKDSAKAWRQKVILAIDAGIRYDLLDFPEGSTAKFIAGPATAEQARVAHAAEVMGAVDE